MADRGAPGIPTDDRERVFAPFPRLGDADNTNGVGLGLALSRGLAESMGGSIVPENTPGGGLTLTRPAPVAASGNFTATWFVALMWRGAATSRTVRRWRLP